MSKFKILVAAIVLVVIVTVIVTTGNASYISHALSVRALMGDGTGGGGHGIIRALMGDGTGGGGHGIIRALL